MAQPIYDININQNATFKFSIQLQDASGSALNIVSWSFSGSIKRLSSDADPPFLFFTCSVVDLTQSIVRISLTPAQTTQLTDPNYVYDVIGTNYTTTPDEVYRILQGKVRVNPGITDPSVTE